ncbi:YppF family protein [Geobacillus stearothermophilus]|uniref:YppF family protein n=1 Tax=Geobacillus stearothermophilus TaxID=1422 RepID=UPI002402BF3C|nr:YppF family protein [Geobacillus stearothermophilus]MDF9296301.1 YppF family protein [Geobacillus stearothermophilus]
MSITELKHKFMAIKHCEPAEANELLDFARRLYLRREISLAQYRDLVRELEQAGACQPDETEEYAGL